MENIISFYSGHDSSICFSRSGQIVCHMEIERVSRIKNHRSINHLDMGKWLTLFFEKNSLDWNDIDRVVLINAAGGTKHDRLQFEMSLVPKGTPIDIVDHHTSHAASSYYISGFEESQVLTIDGGGNDCGIGFFHGITKELKTIKKIGDGSVGQTWNSIRRFYNETPHGPIGTEGVLMGASPYGSPKKGLVEYFYNSMKYGENIYSYLEKDFERFYSLKSLSFLKIKKILSKTSEEDYFDVCASLQKATEIFLEELIVDFKKDIESQNICLAGGVLLNCVAIGKVFLKHFENVFCSPVMGDAGLTLGACLLASQKSTNHSVQKPVKFSPYLGLVQEKLNLNKVQKLYPQLVYKGECHLEALAELIANGNVIGFFQGRAESGKRALGNRSILADPRNAEMKQIINNKVKHRHWYRPFAPSVIEGMVGEYFEENFDSPYMSVAVKFKESARALLPAVSHVDGTARVHTVSKELNGPYYDLIESFYKITGVAVLLNTSFNDNEPIVENYHDAINCFLRTNIDYLWVEGHLFVKKINCNSSN